MNHLGELPCQIHGILNTDVESLSADWRMHVRRVAGQENASLSVARCLPRHIGKPGNIGGGVKTKICTVEGDERLADVA
jgi:hypothetical protein